VAARQADDGAHDDTEGAVARYGTTARVAERRAPRGSTGEYAVASTTAPARAARERRPPYLVAPDDPALAALRRDVASRLRAVCAGMDAAAFETLVRDVAAFRLRWAPR
jgi:hypothetical protein